MPVETRTKHRNPVLNSFSDGGESSNSAEGIRTYKRRKGSTQSSEEKLREDARMFVETAGQLGGKETELQQDQAMCSSSQERNVMSTIDTLPSDGSDDIRHGHWRNIVLQRVSQSLEANKGGIGSCIQDALASSQFANGAFEQAAESEKCLNFHNNTSKPSSQVQNDPEITSENLAAATHVDVTSDGLANKESDPADVTEMCQRVFRDVIVSENFAMLCKLICEHFQGIRVDRFADFRMINSRMREGVYGQSPTLFSADIQKLWRNFQKIGTEMASLAKGLSDASKTIYGQEVQKLEIGGSTIGTCVEGEHEETDQFHPGKMTCLGSETTKRYPSDESETHSKPDQAEVSGLEKNCTCTYCGSEADVRDCLICDSCEEMYHVSCVGLPGGCIPIGSWFCNSCFDARQISTHESCAVCERIKSTRVNPSAGDGTEPVNNDVQENSDCCLAIEDVHAESGSRTGCTCKLCGCELKDSVLFRICMHPQCPTKYYHERCLTSQQLKSYGPCWYCPSCLCRKCLTDQDDDKVVLCDGCDHAYHIYCMNPPRSSIPRGKWFCRLCEKRIRAIRKAKMMFEKEDALGVVGAVRPLHLLLSVAEKLKYDEKLASAREKK